MNVAIIAVLVLLLAGAAFFAMQRQAKTKTKTPKRPKQPSKSAGQADQQSQSAAEAEEQKIEEDVKVAKDDSRSYISDQLYGSFKDKITHVDNIFGMLPEGFANVVRNAWASEPLLPGSIRPSSANEVNNLANKFDAARVQLKQSIGSLMGYKISGRVSKSRLKSMWKGLSRSALAYIEAALKLGGDHDTPIWKSLRKAQKFWMPYQMLVFAANSAIYKGRNNYENSLTDIHGKIEQGSSQDERDFKMSDQFSHVWVCVEDLGNLKKCFAKTGVAKQDFDYVLRYLRLRKLWFLLLAQTYRLFDTVNHFRDTLGLKTWQLHDPVNWIGPGRPPDGKLPWKWFRSPGSPFQTVVPREAMFKGTPCRKLYGLDYEFVKDMMERKQTKSVPYGGKCAAMAHYADYAESDEVVRFVTHQANQHDKLISALQTLKP
jgi:hypothetical protein